MNSRIESPSNELAAVDTNGFQQNVYDLNKGSVPEEATASSAPSTDHSEVQREMPSTSNDEFVNATEPAKMDAQPTESSLSASGLLLKIQNHLDQMFLKQSELIVHAIKCEKRKIDNKFLVSNCNTMTTLSKHIVNCQV